MVLNSKLEKMMPLLALSGVVLGFLFPSMFAWLKPLVPWLFAITTLSGALKLTARELGAAIRSPRPVLVYFASAHGLMPLLVFFLAGLIFRGNTDTVAGFVLLYASPAAVTALIWVSINRGDSALALAFILLSVLTAPLLMPGTVYLLLGTRVSIDMTGMVISLIIMVVLPTVIGVASNEISRGKIPEKISPYVGAASKFLVILIMAGNSSQAAPSISFNSPVIFHVILAYICFAVLGYLFAWCSGFAAGLDHRKRAAFLFIAGMRNSIATATIAITFFPEAVAQPALTAMLLQQLFAAIMGRVLLGKNNLA